MFNQNTKKIIEGLQAPTWQVRKDGIDFDRIITERMREISNEPLDKRKNAFDELDNLRKKLNKAC